jgi:pyridoxamine 5'-phosphate oxidase family protein
VHVSVFTPAESAYLQSQRLGRLATVGADGQPHVVPVGFRYNPEHDTIDIGGHGGFTRRKKYRDVRQNRRVAFVVDDLASVDPWRVRGIEIRGEADILETGGQEIVPSFDPDIFRIRPRRIISWGLDNPESYSANARSVP